MSIKSALRKYLSFNHPDTLAVIRAARLTWSIPRRKSRLMPEGFRWGPVTAEFDVDDYEIQERAFMKCQLANADALIDVGANIGLYTCLALSMGKYVVAIEPLTWNLSYLYLNLKENGWKHLEIYPVAVSSQPELAEFRGSGMSASLIEGWADQFNVVEGSAPETRPTPVSTLDILVGRRFQGKKVIVKVDVEGAEYDVLTGAGLLLSMSPKPLWMVEIFSTQHRSDGFNPYFGQVFDLFWRQGYTSQDITGRSVTPDEMKEWVNNRTTLPVSNFVFMG